MAKTWDKMVQAEKIEDLRRDILRVFDALRGIASDLERLNDQVLKASTSLDALKPKEDDQQ